MKKNILFTAVHFFLFILFTTLMMITNSLQANNVKNSAVVFMYHKFDTPKYPSTNIKIEQFESHLNEFSKTKYNVKSLNYITDSIINDITLPENTIGISVDDGDRSFLTVAWPRLKKLGIPVTLFISTNTIHEGNKNNLSWEEIRLLKDEGVAIGSHSHNHSHLHTLTIEELKNEIEKSNKIFLRELGEIPSLFAYPYGEVDEKTIRMLKDYKFKFAFGQHSGVINETSNLYFLPRYSLNEKYGEIERVKFIASNKGLGVYDFIPSNPSIIDNPPSIGFSLLDESLSNKINCFVFDNQGDVSSDLFNFNERIEIRLNRKLSKGRSRLNCTVKDKGGNWRWFGHQFNVTKN